MEFNPRIVRILFLLLKNEEPVKADALAAMLKISRRTVFRELDYIESQLKEYHLVLKRRTKNGIEIQGNSEDKQRLFQKIETSDDFDPKNKEMRHQRLIINLLMTDEVQKVLYYADELKVSETTVVYDIEEIREWFNSYHIQIQKNYGIELVYREEDYRRAVMSCVEKYEAQILLNQDVKEVVTDNLNKLQMEKALNLTSESYQGLIYFLTIAITRIMSGKELHQPQNTDMSRTLPELPPEMIAVMEEDFQIQFPLLELKALHIYLKGCKIRSAKDDEDEVRVGDTVYHIRQLIYRMTEVFDSDRAFELQNDEMFMEGLAAHVKPTIARLVYGMPLNNPLQSQIREKYPDIYEKARRATVILEDATGRTMTDDEIGFIALHFGGAMIRIEQNKQTRRKVDIGVVCSSGIGISSLLASELKYHYGKKIHVFSITQDQMMQTNEKQIDFLVSTYQLKTSLDWVMVEPILTKRDYENISKLIELYAYRAGKKKTNKKIDFSEAAVITNEIDSIIQHFQIRYLPRDTSFKDIIDAAARVNGDNEIETSEIRQGLIEREKLSSQVIEEYQITFLHAKIEQTKNSKFMIFRPEEGSFSHSYLKESRLIIVMLIPKSDKRKKLAISSIGSSVFEDELFLQELKEENRVIIVQRLQRILENYFNQYMQEVYDNEED